MPKHKKQNNPQSLLESANCEIVEINDDEIDNEEIVKIDLTNNDTCEKKKLRNNSATSSANVKIVEEYSLDQNTSDMINKPSITNMRFRNKFSTKELGNTHSITSSYISEADRKAASTSSESSQSTKIQDIRTLKNSNWLNDEVINAYMNLIIMRSESKPDKYPKVRCFNTFLYEQLQKKGYNSVRRWTKKINIFSFCILIVPIHLGNHWCLIQINIKQKIIRYFDSMGSPNNQCLRIMLQYLLEEFKVKKNGQFDSKDWELINLQPNEIPQQRNMHDCGIFACTFAEHLTRQASLNFSQNHMPYFRVKMRYEILTGGL